MSGPSPVLLHSNFGALDWGVVLAYFLVTTLLGAKLAGRQANLRDFFLGGRKLPWFAVAGSIVATELSAVTFVSVPFVVFRPGGDFTYLQLGLMGALLARLVVAYVLIPAYYRREIYSPYEFMGDRLGSSVRSMTSALFALGGVLAQSSRVYVTAVVLELILGPSVFAPLEAATGVSSLAWAVWTIGLVAVLWTLMGGIATVIWTDVILFLVFVIGAVTALAVVAANLDGGFTEMFRVGLDAGKLRLFDFDTDPTKAYTVWTASIAATIGMVGVYGTDQLMAQRMFCCRDVRQARLAMISSFVGQGVTALVMLVGVGLYAYYSRNPLTGSDLALYQENGDRIFPLFIINVIPEGLTGLIIAGIFAAAISSLDSILSALSQTSMASLYLPLRVRRLARQGGTIEAPAEQLRQVRVSRGLVIVWGLVLCLVAQFIDLVTGFFPSLLDLALAMAGYTSGGLLAGFLLAFLPLKINGYGFLYSAPLSVLLVFSLKWHHDPFPWTTWVVAVGGGLLLLFWVETARRRQQVVLHFGRKLTLLCSGVALTLWINLMGTFERVNEAGETVQLSIAWPWFAPAGCLLAFLLGWALSDHGDRNDRKECTA